MEEAFALEPVSDSALDHEIDGALFENAGANPLDDVIPGSIFDDDGVDSRHVQQMAQHQTCGSGSNNSYLRAYRFHSLYLIDTVGIDPASFILPGRFRMFVGPCSMSVINA